jgi:hyperosmotically inducible protein
MGLHALAQIALVVDREIAMEKKRGARTLRSRDQIEGKNSASQRSEIRMSFRKFKWGWVATVVVGALSLSGPAFAVDRPDAWITTKAKIALLTTEGVSGTAIHVDTTDGRVTLYGSVATAPDKTKAANAVRSIEGVREIRDLVQVVPENAKKIVESSDADLKTRVSAALAKDKALGDSRIRVESVNSGVILLSGTAKTLSDHLRALEDASRVDGAVRVESNVTSPNELADAEVWRNGDFDAAKSQGSTASDVWITSAAKIRLLANSDTPALEINVDTTDGIVTLFGTVPSQMVKQAAAVEVRKVGGVKDVRNQLQVVAAKDAERVAEKDVDIKSAVEKRLEARDALADSSIGVEVSNGVARLTGRVDSQVDRMTALTVTRGTSGVRAVLDELELTPSVSSR